MNTKQTQATRPTGAKMSAATPTPTAAPEISGLSDRLTHLSHSAPLLLPSEGVPTSEREREEFCGYLDRSFPELRRLRRRLAQTMRHRDQLARTLAPLMLQNGPQLAERAAGEGDDQDARTNGAIDHAAQVLWDLSQADERFHELAEKVNALEASLLNAVPAAHRRTVRWSLRQIERG